MTKIKDWTLFKKERHTQPHRVTKGQRVVLDNYPGFWLNPSTLTMLVVIFLFVLYLIVTHSVSLP